MIWRKKARTEINGNGSKQNEAKFACFPLDFPVNLSRQKKPNFDLARFSNIFLVKWKYAIFREESPEL